MSAYEIVLVVLLSLLVSVYVGSVVAVIGIICMSNEIMKKQDKISQ